MKNKTERYIKLNSVGCRLDNKTGNTFPITSEGGIDKENCVCPLEDCSDEWYQSLDSYDFEIVKEYKHNNSDFRYTIIS